MMMSDVWYRVDYTWTVDIVPVKAERLTSKTITPVNGYTERKESKGRRYFENFDDAVTFANKRMEEAIEWLDGAA